MLWASHWALILDQLQIPFAWAVHLKVCLYIHHFTCDQLCLWSVVQLMMETTWGNPHQLPHMGDPILGYCNCTSGQGCIFKAKLKCSKSGIRILWCKLPLTALSGLCKPIPISSLDLLLIGNIHQQASLQYASLKTSTNLMLVVEYMLLFFVVVVLVLVLFFPKFSSLACTCLSHLLCHTKVSMCFSQTEGYMLRNMPSQSLIIQILTIELSGCFMSNHLCLSMSRSTHAWNLAV